MAMADGPGDRAPAAKARRGRRPGPSTTKADILAAARSLFGTLGFEGTTLRMIADAAGVDPALVARSFGDKDGLFRAAVEWPWDPAEMVPRVAAGPKSRAGERIARLVIETWEDPDQRAPILALVASTAVSEVARKLLGDFVTLEVQVPMVRACGFDRAEVRGGLVGAHLLGLAMARYVLAVEPLASLPADELVTITGQVVQRILTMPLPGPGVGRHEQQAPLGSFTFDG
jgi:AcrR family transcriptional regulator